MFDTRTVRHLHLTAGSREEVRHGVLLLEDAMRTASLPAANGRLLIVRRLALERIHPHGSAASVALAIEQKIRQLAITALPADHPHAPHAVAVTFASVVEAHVALALHLARGLPATAWFWPLAVPVYHPQESRTANLRRLLFNVAQPPSGPAAVVRLVAALLETDALSPLLAVVSPVDGESLWQLCVWRTAVPQPVALPMSESETLPPIARHWIRQWGGNDRRSAWLAAVILAAARPSRLGSPHLAVQAQAMARHIAAANKGAEAGRFPVDSYVKTGKDSKLPAPAWPVEPRSPDDSEPSPGPRRSPKATGSINATLPIEATELKTKQPPLPEAGEKPVFRLPETRSTPDRKPAAPYAASDLPFSLTAGGGLFFLVPVLYRLGMNDFMQDPGWIECDFAVQLLRLVCERLRLPTGDPIWQALTTPPTASLPERYLAPLEQWANLLADGPWRIGRIVELSGGRVLCDGSGRLPLAGWSGALPGIVTQWLQRYPWERQRPLLPTTPLDLALSGWLVAARRWCRRVTGLGLRDLVSRPASLALTPTHLDLIFTHNQADLRLRRAGLDLDLGWVPWLGRIVNFHYE
jgi:hypothetical protein